MYNWDLQNAIAALVNALRPSAQLQSDLYLALLHGFANLNSALLTMLGFPPR